MKFKYLFENDLITLSEIPLHIQDLGEVFAQVSETLSEYPETGELGKVSEYPKLSGLSEYPKASGSPENFGTLGELGNVVYIVNHSGWKAFTVISGKPKEYNPLLHSDDPKELLIRVSQDFEKPCVKYIVS